MAWSKSKFLFCARQLCDASRFLFLKLLRIVMSLITYWLNDWLIDWYIVAVVRLIDHCGVQIHVSCTTWMGPRRATWTLTLDSPHDHDITSVTSTVDVYLGQYYELQDDTFSSTSPIYVTRSNASIWLYYNFKEGRWELGDRISAVNYVVFAFSSNTSSYDAPPAVSDWTFPAENTTVFAVTLSCTC